MPQENCSGPVIQSADISRITLARQAERQDASAGVKPMMLSLVMLFLYVVGNAAVLALFGAIVMDAKPAGSRF
jgi:hypothetical protein